MAYQYEQRSGDMMIEALLMYPLAALFGHSLLTVKLCALLCSLVCLLGWVYLIKSELLRKGGKLAGARDLANKSLDIFQKAGEPYYVARSHRQLAQTFMDGGDKTKASQHAGQARTLYQRMGIPEPQIRT